MAVDDPGDNVGEIANRLHVVELRGFYERGDDRPMFRPGVGACKERVLPIESNWPDGSLDSVGVDLDAAVVDEPGQPIPA